LSVRGASRTEPEILERGRFVKLGIIGLPGCGKTTIFRALTGGMGGGEPRGHLAAGLGVVKVEDDRLDYLAATYKPKKVTPVHVEYIDIPGLTGEGQRGKEIGDRILAHLRPVDALIHCVRFFDSPALGPAEPLKDLQRVEEEMILSDLAVVEKRIDRIDKDIKRGRKELRGELELLEQARTFLDNGEPLRFFEDARESEQLRGFAFLSSKPELFLVNASENVPADRVRSVVEDIRQLMEGQPYTAVDWIYGDTEAEIARLAPEDTREFLEELDLEEGAKIRIVKLSFGLLKMIVFFTVSDKEVRAWPLRKDETALGAAGTVHTDMQRGFIRAEVIPFNEFKEAGSMPEAQKTGNVRLEGKDYVVNDGEIIFFRFNV
jgi:GTP-binding protein YchF